MAITPVQREALSRCRGWRDRATPGTFEAAEAEAAYGEYILAEGKEYSEAEFRRISNLCPPLPGQIDKKSLGIALFLLLSIGGVLALATYYSSTPKPKRKK